MEASGAEQSTLVLRGFSFTVYYKPAVHDEGILVCHHGIGSSAQTFAKFLESLHELNPNLGFLTYDVRHHGSTLSLNDEPEKRELSDLDIDTLVDDLEAILFEVVRPKNGMEKPALLLLGHSMGGSVIAKAANDKEAMANYNLRGIVVVDAVEGYARKALGSMGALLSRWPQSFQSIDEAIKWHVGRGGQLRNLSSAKISVPPLLRLDEATGQYVWKLNLKRTESNWNEWFDDLDERFLSAPAARLLILAGTGRLDTPLTRAQMQGKFQMLLVNEAGHYIQEDAPDTVAKSINDFWQRNGRPIKISPKFGQIRTN